MLCLIVEDDPTLRHVLSEALRRQGHEVREAKTLAEGRAALLEQKFGLLVLDYQLPDGTSLALSEYAAATCPNLRIVLLTGSGVFPHGEMSRRAPWIDWLMRKPLPLSDFEALADHAERDARRCPVDCRGCMT